VTPPSDQARLARVFGVPPTRVRFALGVTAGLGVLAPVTGGVTAVVAGGVLAGLGGMLADDRLRIAKHLREVDDWGFPVEGYRAWLLAEEPTFDLELRREIATDLLATSVAAIDARIVVERRGERVVRIVTRRVDLPPTKYEQAARVADRRLLFELRDRVLLPLHADVRIAAMRMGDRASLAALVASPDTAAPPDAPLDEVGGAFRDQARVAPPALQALVHAGTTQLVPAREARTVARRNDRLLYASGHPPAGAGTVIAISAGTAFSVISMGIVGIGTGIGAVVGLVAGIALVVGRNRSHLRAIAEIADKHGFAVEGYEDWLLSGRPILDIEMKRPPDRAWLADRMKIEAFSTSAGAHVPWVEELTWLSDTVVRVETKAALIETGDAGIPSFYGGSHVLFEMFVHRALVPLHDNVGIVAVRMGGYIDRRT
jgi:hypothetical protein